MAFWARIDHTIVAEVLELSLGVAPGVDIFHRDLTFVQCPSGTTIGSIYESGAFHEAPVPRISPEELAAVISAACRNRIYARISDNAQKNLIAYMTSLSFPGAPAVSDEQKTDIAIAQAIFSWISGMQAKCRALIALGDTAYADEWPAWNDVWTALVNRL